MKQAIIGFAAVLFLNGCQFSGSNVPFPSNENEFAQPTSEPLIFSKEEKINWQPANADSNKPITESPFDLYKIPSKTINLGGFQPFTKPMLQSPLNWNSLPDSAFNIKDLPTQNFKYKLTLLGEPLHVKAGMPKIIDGATTGMLTFGEESGLPAKSVNITATDSNGIIWIGTGNGLCRYNGTDIDIYGKDQGLNGVSIIRLFIDKQNKIWIATSDHGLQIIDLENGIIKELDKENGLGENSLWGFLRDNKGRTWIGSWGGGVDIIDEQDGTIRHFTEKHGLSNNAARYFYQDKSGQVWVGAGNGTDIINEKTGKIKHLKKENGLSNNDIEHIMEDSQGQIWLSTRNEVNILDFKKGIIKHLGKDQGLTSNNTRVSLEDNKGQIWIGGTDGANVINEQAGTIKSFGKEEGLAGQYVGHIMQNNHDQIWFSTSAGLNIINQKTGNFRHINFEKELNKKYLSALIEDDNSNLCIGALNWDDPGLYILNKKTQQINTIHKSALINNQLILSLFQDKGKQIWVGGLQGIDIVTADKKMIRHISTKNGLSSNLVTVFFEDDKEQVWIGTGKGITIFDKRNGSFKQTAATEQITNDTITTIKQDNKGQLWVGTFSKLYVIHQNTGTIKQLILNKHGGNPIFDVSIAKNGLVWAGTNNGLKIIEESNAKLYNFSGINGLADPAVYFVEEVNNTLFAGTGKGLSTITLTQTSAADTGGSYIWRSKIFNRAQGFGETDFASSSSRNGVYSKDGNFWWIFGNSISVMEFPLDDSIVPPSFITGIDIFNKPVNFSDATFFLQKLNDNDTFWSTKRDTFYTKKQLVKNKNEFGLWDSLVTPFCMPANLKLPYYQNHITFHFSGLHTANPDKMRYRYFLEGFDETWSAISEKPISETYLNLAPGTYTFKVASKGFNNTWSKPAEFKFSILSPWWKTWWAYLVYTLLFGTALWAYSKYRSRNLQRQNKLLEEKVNMRTKALNESLNELKSTQSQLIQSEKMASLGELTAGIAHEIQNPLNFVNNFSEVNSELISEMKDELNKGNIEEAKNIANDIKENEQKINHHGKRADAIVKGMLQHSRSSNGQKEPTDINALADEYLRLAYHGLRAKDKSFNATLKTDYDERIDKINVIPQDIGRVILNLITNAFYVVDEKKKSGVEGYEPTVTINTKKAGNSVLISVKDNGNGIPQKVLDKIFQPFFTTKPTGQGTGLGLSLSYDIVKAHGGELKVETKEGEGTIFIISIPG